MRGEGYSLSDIAAATGNNGNNGGFGDNGSWWVIIFLIFAFMGWGNRGFGGNNGNGSNGGAMDGYVLASDFAQVDRKLDSIANGICDSTFALNNTIVNGNNALQNTLNQGFAGLNTGMITQGYETRLGINGLSSQLASCCCDLKEGIQGSVTQGIMNTNAIQNQISSCCCDLEKMNMQNRFDAQTYNCNTLQAIDKLGDRIIDRLTQDKIDTLQSENQSLRFTASQERQNAYLLNELKPCPSAAYIVPNPNCCYNYTVSQNGCCGCGSY